MAIGIPSSAGTVLTRPDLSAPLAVLHLPPYASTTDVKHAFRQLVRELHPDATGGEDGSHEQLASIVSAYREVTRSGVLDRPFDDGLQPRGRLVDVRA